MRIPALAMDILKSVSEYINRLESPVQAERFTSIGISLLLCACGQGDDLPPNNGINLSNQRVLDVSAAYSEKVGDHIGRAREGRFIGEGMKVLILDAHPPHLHLYDLHGNHMWSGGEEGGGPHELDNPQGIATRADTLWAIQQGKIASWRLDADSLAFLTSKPLPSDLFPLGLEHGCGGELILYARNDRQFKAPPDSTVAEVGYLHTLRLDEDSAEVATIWSNRRMPGSAAILGHSGRLISRTDSSIALWHREVPLQGGEFLEFDCGGKLIRRVSEADVVRGNDYRVSLPATYEMDWTSGIIALPGGFAVPLQRYISKARGEARKSHWKTEVVVFHEGYLEASVVLDKQWQFLEYDSVAGLLMGSSDPVPHFIVVEPPLLPGN